MTNKGRVRTVLKTSGRPSVTFDIRGTPEMIDEVVEIG